MVLSMDHVSAIVRFIFLFLLPPFLGPTPPLSKVEQNKGPDVNPGSTLILAEVSKYRNGERTASLVNSAGKVRFSYAES